MLHTTAHLYAWRYKFRALPIILVGEALEQDTPDREGEDKSTDEAGHEPELGAQAAHGTVEEFCGFWVHEDVIVTELAHCGSTLVGWEVVFFIWKFSERGYLREAPVVDDVSHLVLAGSDGHVTRKLSFNPVLTAGCSTNLSRSS
jgi:hypothetical protein